jgi:beta-mannosidase
MLTPWRALPLLALAATAQAKGLTDEPFTAGAHQALTGPDATLLSDWTATPEGAAFSINATVPGDLITDLERAGKIGDPLYERNFKGQLWDATNWTFSAQFAASEEILQITNGHVYMVLDGVKMGAWVYLGDNFLGAVSDQFLRYRFEVTQLLDSADTIEPLNLRLVFPPSNHSLNDEARWMACSGAWDWAPYTSTYNSRKAHTMSKGIWKSIYLVGVPDGEAALEHLQPQIYYNGSYPTAPLTDSTAGAWTVVARVHLFAPNPSGGHGTITVNGSWGGSAHKRVQLYKGGNVVELTIPVAAGEVSLWWPNGLGAQTLYNLTVHSEIMPMKDHSNIR